MEPVGSNVSSLWVLGFTDGATATLLLQDFVVGLDGDFVAPPKVDPEDLVWIFLSPTTSLPITRKL
jgi:hypothetical protein